MDEVDTPLYEYDAHFRAIRTAIVALVLAVLALPLLLANHDLGFPLVLFALVAVVYSFVPTLSSS